MEDLISLEIITPLGMIYKGKVKSVVLPGSEGEFGVLKGHSSLVSSLKYGVIDIEMEDLNHEFIAIDGGHCKVDSDNISILAKNAVYISGNSDSGIEKSIQEAKDLIKSISSDSITLAATFSKIDNARLTK